MQPFIDFFVDLPLFHDSSASRRHAVNRHIHLAMLVADSDAETAKIGANYADFVVRPASQLQPLSLTPIRGLVACSVRSDT